jgi:heme-degrading monooxygenase HmoA
MSVARIWRTTIDVNRADEYERFANDQSLLMFRRHDGFLGVVFAGQGADRIVITFWRRQANIDALNSSPFYRETVEEIEATGFIAGPSTTEAFEIHGGTLGGVV